MIIYIEKKKRPGSKLKSNTPLLFGIDPVLKKRLKDQPRKALELFKQNKGNAWAWEALMFRVRSAYETSLQLYVEQTQSELKVISDLLEGTFAKQTSQEHWVLNEHEISEVEVALDAMDSIQDDCTRKQLLDPFVKTKAFMIRFKR